MKLFKYTIISEYDEPQEKQVSNWIASYPYGERGFEPKNIDSDTVFSSKDKALQDAKNKIQEDEEIAYFIIIEEMLLDKELEDSKITVINLINNKEYQFSWVNEYEHQDSLYKQGDWVYFYSNQKLQIGLISYEAEGEEPYLITTENNELNDGHTHDHVSEVWIIKKMDKKEVEKILPYKFMSNIEVRHKLYKIEEEKRSKNKN